MNFVEKLNEFLRKDSGTDNESTKLRYVVRIVLLLSVVYNLSSTTIYSFMSKDSGVVPFVFFFVAFLLVFVSSYFFKKRTFLVVYNVTMLAWIYASVRLFGWDSGVQAVLVFLMVLAFFSGYKGHSLKIAYSVFLIAFRVYLFFLSKTVEPYYVTEGVNMYATQIANTVFVYSAIGILCYVYSRESQNLEGKLVEYNIQLVNQANTDPLTGLNNRRRVMEYLESASIDSRATGLCVAIADIDFFKKINDNYGHDIGDKVLKSIAQTMISTLGNECVISRWGGEEFLIVFPNMNGDHAYVLLQQLRNEISKLRFEVKDRSFTIAMTYGLSEYDFRSDLQSFIKEADNKLYIGKENGRDQVVF